MGGIAADCKPFARVAVPLYLSHWVEQGYWRRHGTPKIDLETGRAEYMGGGGGIPLPNVLPNVLASFGVTAGPTN